MQNIIGLSGYAGVGKDTAAKGMFEWVRGAFADELKRDLASIFFKMGLDIAREDHKKMGRNLMKELGKLGRLISPDYWIKRLEMNLSMKTSVKSNIVITDVRYSNEAEWIKSKGGVVIYIARPCPCGKCCGDVGPINEEEKESIAKLLEEHKPPMVRNEQSPFGLTQKVMDIWKGIKGSGGPAPQS